MFKCDKRHKIKCNPKNMCKWFLCLSCGKHLFKRDIVTLYFLGCTASKTTTYLYSLYSIKLSVKRLACDRKIMCGTIQ